MKPSTGAENQSDAVTRVGSSAVLADIASMLHSRFKAWEMAADWEILAAIGMVEGVTAHHNGAFDSVGYEQQRNERRAMLQKLRKAKLIRWRPTYRKWQYVG